MGVDFYSVWFRKIFEMKGRLPSLLLRRNFSHMKNMVRKTLVNLTGSILLIVAVSGCAGLPGKVSVAPGPSPAEVKLMEENKALDSVNEQSSGFYAQLNALIEDIAELRGRPYWNDFEQVLLEYPLLRDPDNEAQTTPEMKSRFLELSEKWKIPWTQMLDDYTALVDKCTILEARKLAVREKLLSVQAGYIAVVIMEASAGHEKQGKEVYSVVEALDKSGAELDSYQPDDLGLYPAGSRR
jgi:hypothetical protein